MNVTATPHRILITGIAGNIGRCIAPALASRGHIVTGLDTRPHPDFPTHVGNITDVDLVRAAMRDIDTVIHLAALAYDADFVPHLLQPNVVGMINVCQRASADNVTRLILASTGQVHYGHFNAHINRPITVADGPAPDNFYALTKVFAEHTGRMIARTHPNLSVFAARIGWFHISDRTLQRMQQTNTIHAYLSPNDTIRFFTAAVECPPPPPPSPSDGHFAILFAYSKPAYTTVDLHDTERIVGYKPQDDFPTPGTNNP